MGKVDDFLVWLDEVETPEPGQVTITKYPGLRKLAEAIKADLNDHIQSCEAHQTVSGISDKELSRLLRVELKMLEDTRGK